MNKKATKLSIIQKLFPAIEKMIKYFDYLELIFISVAVIGTFLAIKFTQMGGFISLNGIVYQLVSNKAKESSKSLKKELQKSERTLGKNFSKDLNQFKNNQQQLFQVFQELSVDGIKWKELKEPFITFLEKKIDKFNKSFESSFSSISEEKIKKIINFLQNNY
jgi:hypothetical protein